MNSGTAHVQLDFNRLSPKNSHACARGRQHRRRRRVGARFDRHHFHVRVGQVVVNHFHRIERKFRLHRVAGVGATGSGARNGFSLAVQPARAGFAARLGGQARRNFLRLGGDGRGNFFPLPARRSAPRLRRLSA